MFVTRVDHRMAGEGKRSGPLQRGDCLANPGQSADQSEIARPEPAIEDSVQWIEPGGEQGPLGGPSPPVAVEVVEQRDDVLGNAEIVAEWKVERRGLRGHFQSTPAKLRMIWMPAGPMRTMNMTGKMQATSGKMILTGIFIAFSSAR